MNYVRKYIKNILSEASGYIMENFYHGSPYEFEKFDISRVGTGDALSKYGWGLYFTDSPNTALKYAQDLSIGDNRENGFNIYEVKLIGLNYFLNWEEQIPSHVADDTYSSLVQMGLEDSAEQFKAEHEEYEWTTRNLYEWLEAVLNTNKAASQFLYNKCNVHGIIAENAFLRGKIYVAFSDEIVKVISHNKSSEFNSEEEF